MGKRKRPKNMRIKGYTRKGKNGKRIRVKGYLRKNDRKKSNRRRKKKGLKGNPC